MRSPARPILIYSSQKKFLLISLIGLVPAILIMLYSAQQYGRLQLKQGELELQRQLEALSTIQSRISLSARQTLNTLATLPQVRASADCPENSGFISSLMADIHRQNPEFLNIALVDRGGIVQASARLAVGTSLADRDHVKAAVAGQAFGTSGFIFGRVGDEPALSFARPVYDDRQEVIGALTMTFRLDTYASMLEAMQYDEAAMVLLLDKDGEPLFQLERQVDYQWLLERSQESDAMVAARRNGQTIQRWRDPTGGLWLVGLAGRRIQEEARPYIYILLAQPHYLMSRQVQAISIRTIVWIIVSVMIALLIAWTGSKALFGRRLARILSTTSEIQHGNLAARTGLPEQDNSDMGQIGQAIDAMAGTIQERSRALQEATARQEESLREKEILLKEVHHRVKNNMQLMLSLINLEKDRPGDSHTSIQNMEQRITAMALVHEFIYQTEHLDALPLDQYLEKLTSLLHQIYGMDNSRLHICLVPVSISLEKAIPLGLLINELLTNAYKYGSGADGQNLISIESRQEGETIVIELADSGPGLPQDFSLDSQSSLGLRLVAGLTHQLGGSISWRNSPGACFILRLPLGWPRP